MLNLKNRAKRGFHKLIFRETLNDPRIDTNHLPKPLRKPVNFLVKLFFDQARNEKAVRSHDDEKILKYNC